MALSTREVAEAFSSHRFEDAFAHLDEDVVWRMPGSDGLDGRAAVVEACRATARALADMQIAVERFIVIESPDAVAIDTVTTYRDGEQVSKVASCDIYEFRGASVVQITSYTVEV